MTGVGATEDAWHAWSWGSHRGGTEAWLVIPLPLGHPLNELEQLMGGRGRETRELWCRGVVGSRMSVH